MMNDLNPAGGAGAQLEELAAAVHQKRKAIEADQNAIPLALQLALQNSISTSTSADSRCATCNCWQSQAPLMLSTPRVLDAAELMQYSCCRLL